MRSKECSLDLRDRNALRNRSGEKLLLHWRSNNDLVGLHDLQMEDIYNHLDSYLAAWATWGIRVESGFNQSTNQACLVIQCPLYGLITSEAGGQRTPESLWDHGKQNSLGWWNKDLRFFAWMPSVTSGVNQPVLITCNRSVIWFSVLGCWKPLKIKWI